MSWGREAKYMTKITRREGKKEQISRMSAVERVRIQISVEK